MHGSQNVKLEFILKWREFYVHVGFKYYIKQEFAKDRINWTYNVRRLAVSATLTILVSHL
jgi:hypothetical protein